MEDSHLHLPLVTLPGHHCQSHLEEVTPFPVTEHLLTDEGCSELGPLYHPESPQPCRPLVCPHAPGFLLPGDHCLRGRQSSAPFMALSCPWQLSPSRSILVTCSLVSPSPSDSAMSGSTPVPPRPAQAKDGRGAEARTAEAAGRLLAATREAESPGPGTPTQRSRGVASPVLPGPRLPPPSTPFSCKLRCPKAPLHLHPSLALLSRPSAARSPQLAEAPRLVPGSPRH